MNNQVLQIDLCRTYLYIFLIVIDSKCDKGDLISESFSLWLKFSQKGAKSLRLFRTMNRAQVSDFALFFGDLGQNEQLSEIKPPLIGKAKRVMEFSSKTVWDGSWSRSKRIQGSGLL